MFENDSDFGFIIESYSSFTQAQRKPQARDNFPRPNVDPISINPDFLIWGVSGFSGESGHGCKGTPPIIDQLGLID